MVEPNTYSATWHAVFGETQPAETTGREVAFLARLLPSPEHPRVLDVCCGAGRHLAALSRLGYEVTGVERDPAVAEAARRAAPRARVVQGDVKRLADLVEGPFDAALCLWASFGYGSPAENERLLQALSSVLREGGRLVLDVHNRAFFEARTGERTTERGERTILERSTLDGDRLTVSLDYGTGVEDVFSWQVLTPDELVRLARAVGLAVVLVCSTFDEDVMPSSEHARMQLVLEREG